MEFLYYLVKLNSSLAICLCPVVFIVGDLLILVTLKMNVYEFGLASLQIEIQIKVQVSKETKLFQIT
jgi:hypothetical protein